MKKTKILIPIFNGWKSLITLLVGIDTQLYGWDADVSVLIVNDASTDVKPDFKYGFSNIKSIKIINMKKNISILEVKKYLKTGNAKKLNYADNTFDLVISITTIHNLDLDECKKSLQEIKDIGRKIGSKQF